MLESLEQFRDEPLLKIAHDICRWHHERYDGTGYPRGLAGQNIPYMARILTIADCFDAMTAKRPYKQALLWNTLSMSLKKTAVRNLILCLSKNLWSSSMKEKFRLHNRSFTYRGVSRFYGCFYRCKGQI